MRIKQIATFTLAALLVAGTAGGIAYATGSSSDQDGRDMAALATMNVTLQQAITTAELKAGGRAVGADVVHAHGTVGIAVEIVAAQGVKTVLVDGQSGLVTATHDGGKDGEDAD